MRWINFAPAENIPEGSHLALTLEDIPIVVFKQDNHYYAIQNRCTHEDYPLMNGLIEDFIITCPLHGAKFSIKTGAVLSAPAFEDLPIFETRITNGMIQIAIPDFH